MSIQFTPIIPVFYDWPHLYQILEMKGELGKHTVVVLIDCGASHNFISRKLVDELQLLVEETPTYSVEVGDGHKVRCRGKCSQLKLMVQAVEVVHNFYLFGLSSVDVVLGLDWLASLGAVKADFGKMELTLRKGTELVTLTGDPSLTNTELSFGAFMQVLLKEGEGLLVHCDTRNLEQKTEREIPPEVTEVLLQFGTVFQDPQGLPPKRRHDHSINLKEGSEIPNLRPYKCPYYQKTESES